MIKLQDFRDTLTKLEDQLKEAEKAAALVEELRGTIRSLKSVIAKAEGRDVTSNEYAGMDVSDAVVRFLRQRGSAADVETVIYPALRAGGLEVKGRNRNGHLINHHRHIKQAINKCHLLRYEESGKLCMAYLAEWDHRDLSSSS